MQKLVSNGKRERERERVRDHEEYKTKEIGLLFK